MVSEEKIFSYFSNYKSMLDNDTPRAWPIWAPGTRLAGFMKGVTNIDIKYLSSGSHGFRIGFRFSPL